MTEPARRRQPPLPLTVAQVARMCGVSPTTVRVWLTRGHVHRDHRGRIDPAELLAYLDRRGTIGQRKSARDHGLPKQARDQQRRAKS